jgi:putative ABC transport system substrate-binding protein
MPTLSTVSRHAEMGLLLTYGPDIDETYARAALFVDKILKGSKPGELPVEQPTTILTVLNAKTAKSLGLQIPNSILVQATKVIE